MQESIQTIIEPFSIALMPVNSGPTPICLWRRARWGRKHLGNGGVLEEYVLGRERIDVVGSLFFMGEEKK
jgi:hypothetical protein